MWKHSSGQALKLCRASLYIDNEVHRFPTLVVNSTQWFYMVLCPLQWYTIYWLMKLVSSHTCQCVVCWRPSKPMEDKRMSNLPTERMESFPLATYCGATFEFLWRRLVGPFKTKQGCEEHKKYALLFTCFSSCAVYVELLWNLSTNALVSGLHCFFALWRSVNKLSVTKESVLYVPEWNESSWRSS